jgi:glycosidase
MKVIIDFVPNHVARQYHSDGRPVYVEDLGEHDNTSKAFDINNNFYYIPGQPLTLPFGAQESDFEYSEFPAKATGNDRFDAFPNKNDWYETVKINYGIDYVHGHTKHFSPIPDTWNKMRDILLFWASKGVDGFRCDMAEMVPVEFWNWIIPFIKQYNNNVCFIAEVYNPAEYRNFIENGRFDYLYDKVGLYDTLRGVICGTVSAKNITTCWEANEGIQTHMLNFLENHDEQRIASNFFANNANRGIPGMAVAALMNINPVMLYFGQELGERGMDNEGYSGPDGRTTIFDYWSLSSIRAWNNNGNFDGAALSQEQQKLKERYAQLLNIAGSEPAITQGAFYDLMYANLNQPHFNADKQYVFMRKYKNEIILVVANFDKDAQTVDIKIPNEAFQALKFPDNQAATLLDLCTKESSIGTLTSAWPFRIAVSGYDYKVLKFTYHA